MLVYLLFMVAILATYTLTGYCSTQANKKQFLIITAIITIALFGSRHNWYSFADEGMYYLQYIEASKSSFLDFVRFDLEQDYGYYIMMWCMSHVVPWAQFLLYFECAVFVGVVFTFIYKNTKNPLNSVLLLFGSGIFAFYMSAFRQAFALSFALMAYICATSARRKKGGWLNVLLSVVLFLIAMSMHNTAVFFALVFLFWIVKDYGLKILVGLFSAAAMIVFRNQLLEFGNDIFESDYGTGTTNAFLGFILQIVLYLFPFIIMIFYRLRKGNRLTLVEQNGVSTGIVAAGIGFTIYLLRLFSLVFERMSFYMIIFLFPLYESSIDFCIDKKDRRNVYVLVNAALIAIFLYRMLTDRHGGVFTFFWQ